MREREAKPVASTRWWHSGPKTREVHRHKKVDKEKRQDKSEQCPGQSEVMGSTDPSRRLSCRNRCASKARSSVGPPLSCALAFDRLNLVFLFIHLVRFALLLAYQLRPAIAGRCRAAVRQVGREWVQAHGVRRGGQRNPRRERTNDRRNNRSRSRGRSTRHDLGWSRSFNR